VSRVGLQEIGGDAQDLAPHLLARLPDRVPHVEGNPARRDARVVGDDGCVGVGDRDSSEGNPIASAAIWASTVICPPPTSTAALKTFTLPSWFIFMKQ